MTLHSLISSFLSLLVFIVIGGFCGPCPAGERHSNEQFLAANQAYEAGDLATAIGIYESLAAHAGVSASLCYNLSNSYARNGQIGKAVAGYERALLLVPGDKEIQTTLQLLRQDNGLLAAHSGVRQQLATLLGLNQWTALAAFFLVSLALLQLAAWFYPVRAKVSFVVTAGCLLLLAICLVGVFVQYQNWQQAVIISPETSLLISPFQGAESTHTIEEGRLIQVMKVHNNYVLINDDQGRRGWIPASSFERIAITMADQPKP